jgi:hypothetical protein
MNNEQGSFVHLLGTMILPKVQFIALGISLLGIFLYITGNEGANMLLLAGLSTLSACYFLIGFIPPVTKPDSKPNLYSFVVLKIIYIALSVTLIGILFAVMQLEGADNMLLIGCSVLTIGLLISGIMLVTNHDNLIILKSPLLHGLGILLIGVYFINKFSLIPF